jgi:integrase
VVSKSFRRRIDADRWLAGEVGKVDAGAWVDPAAGEVLVAEWAAAWVAGLHSLKPKTAAGYESLLRSRVLPTFGAFQLRQVSAAAIRAWLAAMLDEGLSPARARQARQVLGAMLGQAVADGILVSNPVDRVKAPTVRPRRQAFLTADEVEALAAACEDRQRGAGALVYLLAWSGLRWGEAVALRWSSIDTARRRVRVNASATEVSGRLEWGSPKTHEARSVIVPRFVVDRLGPKGEPDALVFTAPKGGPLRTSNFRTAVWLPAVEAAGLRSDLVPHDLRDTAAALMISAGASIKAVQRALGHASAAMTLDIYGGLFEDDLEDLADRLEARYGDPGAPPARPQASNVVHLHRSGR